MSESRTLDPIEPGAVGIGAARLARIVPALNREVEAGRMPGAVIAIARRGRLVLHEAVGYLDAGRERPMQPDALFAIASMTKPIAGVAGLMMWRKAAWVSAIPWNGFCRNWATVASR